MIKLNHQPDFEYDVVSDFFFNFLAPDFFFFFVAPTTFGFFMAGYHVRFNGYNCFQCLQLVLFIVVLQLTSSKRIILVHL